MKPTHTKPLRRWRGLLPALLLLGCAAPDPPRPPSARAADASPAVARVGDSVYTVERLTAFLEAQPETLGRGAIEVHLQRWVEAQAFAQEAVRLGLASDARVKERLAQVRLDLLRGLVEDRALAEPVEIGDRDLKRWARSHPELLTVDERQVKLAWYSAADSSALADIRLSVAENRLRSEQLAQPAVAHGRTEFLAPRDMEPAIADRVAALDYLELTPVLRLQQGFVFYQIVGQRPAGYVLPLESAEGEIRQRMEEERRLDRLRARREEILDRLDYTVDLGPFFEQQAEGSE